MSVQAGYRFKTLVKLLHAKCSPTQPIQVVLKDLSSQNLCGSCLAYVDKQGKIKRFVLEIHNDMAQLTLIDTLLHEWAHALDQSLNGLAKEPHRNSWGKCYAKVWRAYVQQLGE
jgi:hypothetical protein